MDGNQRLAETFVELADTLVESFDTVDFMQLLTDRCVELLAADAAGVLMADPGGVLRWTALTPQRRRLLELFEIEVDEGPCRDCFVSRRPLHNVDLDAAHDRWPA